MAAKQEFESRFAKHKDELEWLFMELYHNREGLEVLEREMAEAYNARSAELKALDKARSADPEWYKRGNMFGMTMYTDLFAGNLKELAKKLPYLKEQKLTHPADHKSRFHRGNDGRDHGTPLFLFRTSVLILRLSNKFRHVDRETGAGDDHIRSGFHRLFHIGRVLLRRDHDIKAQNPLGRFLPGFLKLGMNRSQIRRHRIFSEILILKSDLGRGNDSDSSRLRNSSG